MNERVLDVENDREIGDTAVLPLEETAGALERRGITTVRGAGDRFAS